MLAATLCGEAAPEPLTRAFVTGGSGFIGGALIERLRSRAGTCARSLAPSAPRQRVRELGAEPVRGDLDDRDSLRAGAEGCELAFHAAAKVEDWGDPADFERLNVRGTQNVIDACREAGACGGSCTWAPRPR